MAMNNCWIEGNPTPTPQEVEDVIGHQVDVPALGFVTSRLMDAKHFLRKTNKFQDFQFIQTLVQENSTSF